MSFSQKLLSVLPIALVAFVGTAGAQVEVPEGFTVETVCEGLDAVVTMDVARDGRIFICEQTGAVRVVKDRRLLEEPFLRIAVDDFWERGVIGVALHPRFPEEPFVYVHYVRKEPFPHHVVSRFTAEGDRAQAGSELVMIEGEDQSLRTGKYPGAHQGGAMRFGADGKLYVPLGEHNVRDPAQSMESLHGKLLRLNPDGTIPVDNPFFKTASGKCRAIYALGLRNPFGLAVQPGTGRMMIADVGQELFEEIDEAAPGANYGWPVAEGLAGHRAEFTKPLHTYNRALGTCISGVVFYNPPKPQFPTEFVGRLIFADFSAGWLRLLDPAQPAESKPFATRLPNPVDLAVEADGSLLVLVRRTNVHDEHFTPKSGHLLRIHYAAKPVAP